MRRILLLAICLGITVLAHAQYCDPYSDPYCYGGGGTGGSTGPNYGSGTSNFNEQHFVPHIVSGGGFVTKITITNLTQQSNAGQLLYWGQDGSTISRSPFTLAPGQTMRIQTPEASRFGASQTQWLTVSSNFDIGINTFFELSDSTGKVVNTIGFNDPQEGTNFVFPVEFQPGTASRTVGLAIANDTSDTNTVTLTLVDANGNSIASAQIPLAAFAQVAQDLSSLPAFKAVLPNGNFIGTVTVTATKTISTIALGDDLGPFYSTPPLMGGETGQLLVPHIVTGGGFVTKLTVMNLANVANPIDVKFFDQAGNLLQDQALNLAAHGTGRISTAESDRFGPTKTTWAIVNAPQAAAVNLFFELEDSATNAVVNTVGFNNVDAGTAFTIPVEFMPATSSTSPIRTVGLALANPSTTPASVTLKLVDPTGAVLATSIVPLGANAQTAIDLSNVAEFKATIAAGAFNGVVSISSNQAVGAIALGDDFGPFYSTPTMSGSAH